MSQTKASRTPEFLRGVRAALQAVGNATFIEGQFTEDQVSAIAEALEAAERELGLTDDSDETATTEG